MKKEGILAGIVGPILTKKPMAKEQAEDYDEDDSEDEEDTDTHEILTELAGEFRLALEEESDEKLAKIFKQIVKASC